MKNFEAMKAAHAERMQQREKIHPSSDIFQAYIDVNLRFPQSSIDIAMPAYVLHACLEGSTHPDDLLDSSLSEEQIAELIKHMRRAHNAYGIAQHSTTSDQEIQNRLQGLWKHAIGTTSQYLRDLTTKKPFTLAGGPSRYDELRTTDEYKQLLSETVQPFLTQVLEILRSEGIQKLAAQYRETMRGGGDTDAEKKIAMDIACILQHAIQKFLQEMGIVESVGAVPLTVYPPWVRDLLKPMKKV